MFLLSSRGVMDFHFLLVKDGGGPNTTFGDRASVIVGGSGTYTYWPFCYPSFLVAFESISFFLVAWVLARRQQSFRSRDWEMLAKWDCSFTAG